jgi:hypothetical protein
MRSVNSRGGNGSGRAPVKILAAAAVLCAAFAARPAPAQEGGDAGAPAGGGEAPPAGVSPGDGAAAKGQAPEAPPPAGDIELLAPRRAPAGLWRRANLKMLIANAHGRTAAVPAGRSGAGTFPVRLPVRTGNASVPRNAIGLAVAPPPDHGTFGRATSQGTVLAIGPARHATAINGTAMNRPSGAIGGPAAGRAGINGTLVRPRW